MLILFGALAGHTLTILSRTLALLATLKENALNVVNLRLEMNFNHETRRSAHVHAMFYASNCKERGESVS